MTDFKPVVVKPDLEEEGLLPCGCCICCESCEECEEVVEVKVDG